MKSKIRYNEDTEITVIREENGQVESICINDICKVLGQDKIITSGKIHSLCPALHSERKRLYSTVEECKRLVGVLSEGRKYKLRSYNRMKEWIDKVSRDNSHVNVKMIQSSSVEEEITLEYRETEFRARNADGRLYFNATQMARSYGKYPSLWLNLTSTRRFRMSLVAQGRTPDYESQVYVWRGKFGTTWIESHLLIEFGRWLSEDFGAWCNDVIMKLMNEGEVKMDEVMTDSMRSALSEPYSSDGRNLQAVCERQRRLIEQSQHKVEYYERMVENRDWFFTTVIALELEISAFQLNVFLCEQGVQCYRNGRWVPMPEYQKYRIDAPYIYENKKLRRFIVAGKRNVWTPEGREFIINLWKKRHF